VFISGDNPNFTSQFCGVVLGSTTISKNKGATQNLLISICLYIELNC